MYTLKNDLIKPSDILDKIDELHLWKFYCNNFKSINTPFKSELYKDNNPDCRIYQSNSGRYYYKDFGNGDRFTIFEYVQNKYNCTYPECINIISNDFNIKGNTVNYNKPIITTSVEESLLLLPKTNIQILNKPFDIVDFNYWDQYKIPLFLLLRYNVHSCERVYLIKNNKTLIFNSSATNPIYAYEFKDDNICYKIYFPFANKDNKWLYSGNISTVEGYAQLDKEGDVLIITKSLKDCMCYRVLGYNAIALHGETYKIDDNLLKELKQRFKKILLNYDNDSHGIENSIKITDTYGIRHFFVDGDCKDLSDYIKENGLEKAKEMIYNKINE